MERDGEPEGKGPCGAAVASLQGHSGGTQHPGLSPGIPAPQQRGAPSLGMGSDWGRSRTEEGGGGESQNTTVEPLRPGLCEARAAGVREAAAPTAPSPHLGQGGRGASLTGGP